MAHEQMDDRDEDIHLLVKTRSEVNEAHNRFDQEVERLLANLSLPLTNSLDVPTEQVAVKSQEILEALVRLREEREAAINAANQTMETYFNGFPEEEREEVRAKMQILGAIF